jgi:hypothetical protein
VADHQVENRIPEKLQTFVVRNIPAGLLVAERFIGQGLPKQGGVAEAIPDCLFENFLAGSSRQKTLLLAIL